MWLTQVNSYEDYSKINCQLAGIHKLVTTETQCMHIANKSFYLTTHKSVTHIVYLYLSDIFKVTKRTRNVSMPLPPALRCMVVFSDTSHCLLGMFVTMPQMLDGVRWWGSQPTKGGPENSPNTARLHRTMVPKWMMFTSLSRTVTTISETVWDTKLTMRLYSKTLFSGGLSVAPTSWKYTNRANRQLCGSPTDSWIETGTLQDWIRIRVLLCNILPGAQCFESND